MSSGESAPRPEVTPEPDEEVIYGFGPLQAWPPVESPNQTDDEN